jgi:phospholipase C
MRVHPRLIPLVLAPLVFLTGCGGIGAGAGNNSNGNTSKTLQNSLHHIVFMVQENRSFDEYFGALDAYRAAHGLPQDVDVAAAGAANISWPSYSTGSTPPQMLSRFHMISMCSEDLTPSWLESHYDYNLYAPNSNTFQGDGFAAMAGGYSAHTGGFDTLGLRAMGYYTDADLPWYYFMATMFATSDRWFAPAPTRTQPNRMYLLAATSQGYAYPPTAPLTAKTIFQLLEENGISWKVYVTDISSSGGMSTYMNYFPTFTQAHLQNFVPIEQYYTDVQNGTLPAVALIESGYESGEDEHPLSSVQTGAAYVATVVGALMNSQSWKDTAFILTYDEPGGFYDHVQPMATVNPDGTAPIDLTATDPTGDFTRTGFRVPLIVISPFTKKGYVSHNAADYTAILKFIETRFGLGSLTRRDAFQTVDMTEFFDFNNPPWMTPPTPPAQPTTGPCYYDHLP